MRTQPFNAAATVVGSFPHAEAVHLVDTILAALPELPAWPQLPARDFRESMYVQYSEGLPGIVLDDQRQRIFFRKDNNFQRELETFYEAVISTDVEHFAISPGFASGLHCFVERLRERGGGVGRCLKGQVTGPFSFAMMVTDDTQRAAAYDPELSEVVTQGIALKAAWMTRLLHRESGDALITLDEPYLCSFGSAFVNVSREEVLASLATAVSAIHSEGGRAGLHCCGNTDWSLPLETEIDVLNLDAYEWFQGLPLYPEQLRAFLDRGGHIAWGIIPTSEIVMELDVGSLMNVLDDRIARLVAKGMVREQIYRQSVLTPTCGMGTKSVEVADRVMELLVSLSAAVRDREKLN